MRKTWDEYFISLAALISERATCKRLKVGSVIVKDNKIISTGYNGSIDGHDHCIDEGCLINDEQRCIRTIHAEMNSILHADRNDLVGSTVYVTHEPCENCAKHIAQVGVKRVVYEHAYRNMYNHHFLKGIEVVHYEVSRKEEI